ncbi:phosphatidate cytidylyltransferase, partial [Akkermansiaceae bacterium]|nr:phosphatidate cytidylyltransferase [Akkermansiaceae bacterium]
MLGMADEVDKPTKAQVFRARLTSTLILWGIVTAVFVSQHPWAFFGLIGFLTVAGAAEFFGLFRKFSGSGCRVIGLVPGLAVALATGAILICGCYDVSGFALEAAGLVFAVLAAFCWRFRNGIDGRESVDAVGDSLLAFVYVPILFGSFVFRLLFLPDSENVGPGSWLVLMMIASAKFTDMGAYITGSLIGKNKMAPHLSPAKTWEGFAGALGFAQLAAWSVWGLSGDILT